jgi:uncharacterized protein YbjQ (UPF0145 family)
MPIALSAENVTTAFELPGQTIRRNCGVVRGIVVRSNSVVGNFVAGLQTIMGGNISAFTSLCEQARSDAFEQMLDHAAERGANAIIGMRYDANEIATGVTEVLAYGTAVWVEPGR